MTPLSAQMLAGVRPAEAAICHLAGATWCAAAGVHPLHCWCLMLTLLAAWCEALKLGRTSGLSLMLALTLTRKRRHW